MSASAEAPSQPRASRACKICHRHKIKCNRALPQCTPCSLNKRSCSYGTVGHVIGTTSPRILPLTSASLDLERQASVHQGQQINAATYFLDHDLFQKSGMNPTAGIPPVPSPAGIRDLADDSATHRLVAARFFELIHPWLPIICRQKFYNNFLNPLVMVRTDTFFLYLCMALHVNSPLDEENARTAEYKAAKRCYVELELEGHISSQILQGVLLIAVYEFGHAIYPAAHGTIGLCINLGGSFGLAFETGHQNLSADTLWSDSEERRRTWWAIYLIERVANFGNLDHVFSCPEPTHSALLPGKDDRWSYDSDEKPAALSSPPEFLGRFAGVIQTTFLLSCVFRHVLDGTLSTVFRDQELDQLDRTLHAQIRYQERNLQSQTTIICYQTALSFSALMILYAQYLEPDKSTGIHQPLHNRAVSVANNVADTSVKTVRRYLEEGIADYTDGDVPPFVMPWIYMAGVWLQRQQSKDEVEIIEAALADLKRKWRVAGVYLTLLNTRRVTIIPSDINPSRTC